MRTLAVLFALCQLPYLAADQHSPEPPVAASSDVTMQMPQQVTAQPGEYFEVALTTNCKWIRWTIPLGLKRVPIKYTGEKSFVGHGPAGVYEFRAEGTLNDVYAESKCVVFIGQTPGPKPNGPDGPISDPLLAGLQKLYSEDKSKTKPVQVKALADIYRGGASMMFAKKPDGKYMIETTEQLFETLRTVSDAALTSADGIKPLQPIRESLIPEVKKCFTPGTLTDQGRTTGAECFRRIAGLLELLK